MYREYEPHRQFDAVIFDLDSTLSTIEGIDQLGELNNVKHRIAPLTNLAMNGEKDFEEIFMERLNIIRPHHNQLVWLGEQYKQNQTKGAHQLIEHLRKRHIRPFVISGGYNPSIHIFTRFLGIPDEQVFANQLLFDHLGHYQGIDRTIPLYKHDGKIEIVKQIRKKFPGTFLFIGDGMSDYEAGQYAEQFICFAGVAKRDAVIRKSHVVIEEPNLMTILQYM